MVRFVRITLLVLLLLAGLAPLSIAATPFALPEFERTWARTDKPVADGLVSRTWMWGPGPNSPPMLEPYADAPGGLRTVQYSDKSRFEDNTYRAAPPWDVTNGLIAKELMTGQM